MENFLISVLSGVFGSIIVILLLFICMKPSFSISPNIAFVNNSRFGEVLENAYIFKIINKSVFKSYDILGELEKVENIL